MKRDAEGATAIHISVLLAQKILALFDESGASEAQRLAALQIAKTLLAVWPNSVSAKFEARAGAEASGAETPDS